MEKYSHQENTNKFLWPILAFALLSWLLYSYFTLTAPITSSSRDFQLNEQNLFLIRATIMIPYIAIWLAGVFGWHKLHSYALSIGDATAAKPFSLLARGLLILLLSMVVGAVISSFRSLNPADGSLAPALTILVNYLHTLAPLAGFYFLFIGGKRLTQSLGMARKQGMYVLVSAAVAIFGALYAWGIFTNPNRQIPYATDMPASFYLPDILIATTIMLPAIIGWILGSLAAWHIAQYAKHVGGLVFKVAFGRLMWGVIGVVGASIVLHALLSVGTQRFISIGLGPILIIVYVFLLALGIGYGFVARGAGKLAHIEKV